jgi:hypothetical protein
MCSRKPSRAEDAVGHLAQAVVVTEITIVVPARRAKDEPLLVHMVDFVQRGPRRVLT